MSIRTARSKNIKRQQRKSKMAIFFSLMVKTISIAPFLLISYGAFLLFLFARDHGVNFLDLLTVNILLAFGALYLIFILFLTGTMILTAIFNHLSSNFVHNHFIKEAKIGILRENPFIIAFVLSIIFSSWPFLFFITELNTAALIYIITIIIVIMAYHNFLTTNFESKKLWSPLRISSAFLFLSPAISLVTAVIISNVFIEHIRKNHISDIVGVLAMAGIFMIINLLSFYLPMIEKKKNKKPESIILIASVCFYFLILPNPMSEYTSSILVKQLGIGLQNRCYLKEEIDQLPITLNLKKQTDHNVELAIVANINDIYYISKPGDPDMHARMRFVAEKLTQIGCPSIEENKGETPSNSK